jgi:hypothetical protein
MPTPEISQEELAYIQSLRNQLDSMQQEMRQVAKTVFLRLDKGAHVEPGTHKIRVERIRSRHVHRAAAGLEPTADGLAFQPGAVAGRPLYLLGGPGRPKKQR